MEVIIAIIGTATTIVTIALTNFFTKKNQLRFEERKLKEDYYITYIRAISDSVVSNHAEVTRDNLADIQNKLLLVASADVVSKLMVFHDYIQASNKEFEASHHDKLLRDLIMAMREDLFSNKKVNSNYPEIHLTGKAPRNR